MNELYEKCLQQEKELVFESVTQEGSIGNFDKNQ